MDVVSDKQGARGKGMGCRPGARDGHATRITESKRMGPGRGTEHKGEHEMVRRVLGTNITVKN
jgi:hypothetical protein